MRDYTRFQTRKDWGRDAKHGQTVAQKAAAIGKSNPAHTAHQEEQAAGQKWGAKGEAADLKHGGHPGSIHATHNADASQKSINQHRVTYDRYTKLAHQAANEASHAKTAKERHHWTELSNLYRTRVESIENPTTGRPGT